MPMFKTIEENEATGKVKEVFDDIKGSRGITEIPNFWKMLANDPNELERSWNSLKQVMRKGELDPVTKELIYVAVSITNGCEYCTRSHSYAAKKKGNTEKITRGPLDSRGPHGPMGLMGPHGQALTTYPTLSVSG